MENKGNKSNRDEFLKNIKEKLAKRAGFKCSFPDCNAQTTGPSYESDDSVSNVGVACHIEAAAPGGSRFNSTMTKMQRSSIENGIWLCQTHAKLIDSDRVTYSVEVLKQYKKKHEEKMKGLIGVQTTSPMPEDGLPKEEKLKKKRDEFIEKNDFKNAAYLSEQIVELEKTSENIKLKVKAHQRAVLDLTNCFYFSNFTEKERDEILLKISHHIDQFEMLGGEKGEVYSLRSHYFALRREPEKALEFAQKAIKYPHKNDFSQGEAYIFYLQALWGMNRSEKALSILPKLENYQNNTEHHYIKLALGSAILRTLCKAGKVEIIDIQRYLEQVQRLVAEKKLSPKRVELVLVELSQEFGDNSRMEEALLLCEFRYELAQGIPDAHKASLNASESAEVASILGNFEKSLHYLGYADTWSEKYKFSVEGETEPLWPTLRAMILFNRGRTLFRLAENSSIPSIKSIDFLNESLKAFNDAYDFAKSHRAAIKGDVDFFTADVIFWHGKVFLYMGKPKEALEDFRLVQSILIISRERSAANLWAEARLFEADAARQAGLLENAVMSLEILFTDPTVPGEIKQRAEMLKKFLSDTIMPFIEWYDTSEGKSVIQSTLNEGLRQTVAKQIAPLVSWWEKFNKWGTGELLDMWGRGGFARIAAAVGSSPHNAVAIDARSVEEIAHWARVFCPLFETVIIKWKGVLESGRAVVPLPLELGSPGNFGAQGYVRTRSLTDDGWNVGVGWANLMPRDVGAFIFGEAFPLFKSGRLVVLPASLVGCTQSAVGWTDIFLTEKLLHGIINVVGLNGQVEAKPEKGRIVDLAQITIPFIEGISMEDLSKVLEDVTEFLAPFQGLIGRMICENDLRIERWDKIRALENDVRQASRKLNEKFNSLTQKKSGEKWRIKEQLNSISVGSTGTEHPGSDPVTNLLVSLTSIHPDLDPWVPYWRLQSCGGILDWTHSFNNKSQPPDISAQMEGFNRQDHQTWLYPGDGGPVLAVIWDL